MNTTMNIAPYTAWNLLDHVIVQLGIEGEKICNNRISDDPFYNALVDLVCKEGIRELPRHINIAKPFYPYILLTYYVLLHKGNLDLAKALYKVLSKIYAYNSSIFDRNEETSLKIIGEVIEFLDTLRKLDENDHKKILKYYLEFLVAKLDKVDCTEGGGWSCFFKELMITGLEPNLERRYEKLGSIKEMYRAKFIPIDEELIEGYNLFTVEEFSPIYTFLSSIAERELDSLKQLYKEISELEMEKEDVENRLKKIQDLQRRLHIYAEEAESTLKKALAYWFLIGVCPIYLLSKLAESLVRRNLRKIEKRINHLKSSRVERLAEIIWLSQKPHNIPSPT